jgi:hypothetical protein
MERSRVAIETPGGSFAFIPGITLRKQPFGDDAWNVILLQHGAEVGEIRLGAPAERAEEPWFGRQHIVRRHARYLPEGSMDLEEFAEKYAPFETALRRLATSVRGYPKNVTEMNADERETWLLKQLWGHDHLPESLQGIGREAYAFRISKDRPAWMIYVICQGKARMFRLWVDRGYEGDTEQLLNSVARAYRCDPEETDDSR